MIRKRKFKRGNHVSVVSLDDKNEYTNFINKKKTYNYPKGNKTQTHHIVPFHDGGSDDPENLVSLSFDDHIYAHLLIAKVYNNEIDKMAYRLMAGMEKSIYHAVKLMGAQKTHQILKEKGTNFWDPKFQKKMSNLSVAKDKAQGFKDRSRGGKVAGKLRWKDYLTTSDDKWLFSYVDKPTVCIFRCNDGGDIMKILQNIYPDQKFKRVSPLLNGQRKYAYGWSVEKILPPSELITEEIKE